MKAPVLIASLSVALSFTAAAATGGGGVGGVPAPTFIYSLEAPQGTVSTPPAEQAPAIAGADEPSSIGLLGSGFALVLIGLAGRRKWRSL